MNKIILFFTSLLIFDGCGQLYASEIVIRHDDRTRQKSVLEQQFNIADDHVLIYRSANAIQCETPGISLEKSAGSLTDNNIEIFSSYCGVQTGLAIMAMCGAGTTGIRLHEIAGTDLSDAEQIGFSPVSELIAAGYGYEMTDCP
jgi:hypothetical protein